MKTVLNIEDMIWIIRNIALGEDGGHRTHGHEGIHIALLTKDGHIAYSSKAYEPYEKAPDQFLRRLKKKEAAYFKGRADESDGQEKSLVAFAHSKGYRDYQGLGWILVIEYEEEKIFAPVMALKRTLLAASLFVTILAILIGFGISRGIVNRITRLKDAATKIGRGRLDSAIKIESNDEIGQLAACFNEMVSDLRRSTTSINHLNREIAERKHAEQNLELRGRELETANRQLKAAYEKLTKQSTQLIQAEKMSALGTMAAGIVHEMNNPLMGILNYIQYGLKHVPQDEKVFSTLQNAERETKRCSRIVRDLLTFSRAGRGDNESEYKKRHCSVILDRVFTLLSGRIKAEHIQVTRQIADGVGEVMMKEDHMEQVFVNLMANAIDAMAESERKELRVDVTQNDEFVEVGIRDTGPGIDPQTLEKVFDPFFTTKPAGQGTGLGLAISRSIIHNHQGEMRCESLPGVGTTFRILLPVERKKGGEIHEEILLDSGMKTR